MHTTPQMTCRGNECTLQLVLPFAGPIAAFLGMVVVIAAVAVPAMMG